MTTVEMELAKMLMLIFVLLEVPKQHGLSLYASISQRSRGDTQNVPDAW